jgi:hypothetical protein
MREYRRDVGRYVKGETGTYPLLPTELFRSHDRGCLDNSAEQGPSRRSTELLRSVAGAMENAKIENKWQSSAARIYRNWLQCIIARKSESTGIVSMPMQSVRLTLSHCSGDTRYSMMRKFPLQCIMLIR